MTMLETQLNEMVSDMIAAIRDCEERYPTAREVAEGLMDYAEPDQDFDELYESVKYCMAVER